VQAEDLYPLHDVSERRAGSYRYGMLLELHSLLLYHAVSEDGMHMYRVSHAKEEITKLSLWSVKKIIAQFTSATVVGKESSRLPPAFLPPFTRSDEVQLGVGYPRLKCGGLCLDSHTH